MQPLILQRPNWYQILQGFFWISWIIGSHFSFVKVVVEVCILYMRRGKANSQISDGKSICLQCGRPGFNPWLRKIPWRMVWQPTPVFLTGESPWIEEPHRLQSIGSERAGHDWARSTAWNLDRSYWWTYFEGSNGDADIENRLVDPGKWRRWDEWRE